MTVNTERPQFSQIDTQLLEDDSERNNRGEPVTNLA
jgi:hypothetical protein